jgi:hypothetical protein
LFKSYIYISYFNIVQCLVTLDAVQIGNSFITLLTTRNYNHLFHSYTFTQFTSTTLIFSLYLQQFSRIYNTGVIQVSLNYTLPILTALQHIKSLNLLNMSSLADFSAINYYLKLSHTVAHAEEVGDQSFRYCRRLLVGNGTSGHLVK